MDGLDVNLLLERSATLEPPFPAASDRRAARPATQHSAGMRWFPARDTAAIDDLALHGRSWKLALSQVGVMSVFALPPVARATGVSVRSVFIVWAIFTSWMTLVDRVLHRLASTRPLAFYAMAAGNVVFGGFFALSLPVLGGTPQTPLWVAFTVMACVFGGSEYEACLFYSLFLSLAPLATIPIFVTRGGSLLWAIVGPLLAALGSGYGYWFLARRRNVWRKDRHQREMELAQRRLAESEGERRRLARDLHDSVGTALSLVALYSSMAEHKAENPVESRHFATTIRESARAALDELRGVIQALPQAPTTLSELAASLALVAKRSAEPAGATLTVKVIAGDEMILAGGVRTTIVRVFQEAVHNALHHGKARQIRGSLAAAGSRVNLVIADDGVGFDASATAASAGTGLIGMKERAREQGGYVTVASSPSTGTRILLDLPLPPERSA